MIGTNLKVVDIRNKFLSQYVDEKFVIDKTGVKTIEIINASFIADEETIFGEPNRDYIEREIQWYESCSLKVEDIPGKVPEIWKKVANTDGEINSNYGYLIYSIDNGFQYDNTKWELLKNPDSRRAIMIYTRPSMYIDYNHKDMSDFICTNTVQYVIRDNKLHAIVQMRSNDAWAGYRNDYAWQKHVLNKLANDLEIDAGLIFWNAGSLHLYEKQFNLVENFLNTGKHCL